MRFIRKTLFIFTALLVSSTAFSVATFYDEEGNYAGQAVSGGSRVFDGIKKKPSTGEQFAQAFANAGQALPELLEPLAEKEEKVAFVRAKIKALLQNYDPYLHTEYMNLLAGCPDLSYALKVGLITSYDTYRKERDNLDTQYNGIFEKLAKEIVIEEGGPINDLLRLSLYMDPHKKRQSLNDELGDLSLAYPNNQKILDFVGDYYKHRKFIDRQLMKKEQALIDTLMG